MPSYVYLGNPHPGPCFILSAVYCNRCVGKSSIAPCASPWAVDTALNRAVLAALPDVLSLDSKDQKSRRARSPHTPTPAADMGALFLTF